MQLTALPWGIFKHNRHTSEIYERWFRYAAESGYYEGIDLIDQSESLFGVTERKAESRKLKPVLQDLGLQAVMFVSHTDLRVDEIPPGEQDRIKFLIEQAVFFDMPYFRVYTGAQVPGELFRAGIMENVIKHLRWCMELIKDAGLRPVFENFWETTDELLVICEALAPEGLRMNCEIKPPARYGMNPYTFCERLIPYADTFHLDNFVYDQNTQHWDKDRNGRKLERAVPLQKGMIDVAEILKRIKASGFDGWLSIEYGGLVDRFDHMGESAAFVRQTWDALP